MPHGPEVSLEVGHQEEGQQREGHQVQQGRLGRLEHLKMDWIKKSVVQSYKVRVPERVTM